MSTDRICCRREFANRTTFPKPLLEALNKSHDHQRNKMGDPSLGVAYIEYTISWKRPTKQTKTYSFESPIETRIDGIDPQHGNNDDSY